MDSIFRILITGTSRGIGKELLKRYATKGIQVIAIDKHMDPGVAEAFPSVIFRQVDIAIESEVENLVANLATDGLLPDVYIFNAAVHKVDNDPFIDYPEICNVIAVDMLSTLKFLSCLMPRLEKPATFVFCSSGVVIFPNPSSLGYFLSKLAVTRTFDLFADRYAGCGFRFKSVILGPIESDMLQESRSPHGFVRILRTLTTGTKEKAAEKIMVFIQSTRRHMYYRLSSAIILWCVRLAQALLPAPLKVYRASRPSQPTKLHHNDSPLEIIKEGVRGAPHSGKRGAK